MMKTSKPTIIQDCIPVGCIPPACSPFLPACAVQGDAGSPGGCLLRGVSASGGGVSQHALRHTPLPVNRITDSCKNITFPQLRLWAVTRRHAAWSSVFFFQQTIFLLCTTFSFTYETALLSFLLSVFLPFCPYISIKGAFDATLHITMNSSYLRTL